MVTEDRLMSQWTCLTLLNTSTPESGFFEPYGARKLIEKIEHAIRNIEGKFLLAVLQRKPHLKLLRKWDCYSTVRDEKLYKSTVYIERDRWMYRYSRMLQGRGGGVSQLPKKHSAESFSNDDGDAAEDALQKLDLYFSFECRNCVDPLTTHIGLKTCSGKICNDSVHF